ncbi:MAG: RtcB family protein, partial [Coriobacteriia bacterium]|nr:RtcB family protein [Coriobacteriia bacterium]
MPPRVIDGERIPILVWGEMPDEGTLAQTRNIANLPFAHHHVALMPDAHVGFGMPIGGVFGSVGHVVPHAVGLDIGCGVRAFKTSLRRDEIRSVLDEVLSAIMREVPQGFDWHRESQAHRTDVFDDVPDSPVLRTEKGRAERQVGTLGGGNHFIELQQDEDGFVWVMIHCGSRNVGKQVAEHYDGIARDLNKRGGSSVPPEWGLAHLGVRSAAGAEYLAAMDWCLRFAKENRRLIAESVRAVLGRRFAGVGFEPDIDVHHNYASVERHFGREVVVHRKG